MLEEKRTGDDNTREGDRQAFCVRDPVELFQQPGKAEPAQHSRTHHQHDAVPAWIAVTTEEGQLAQQGEWAGNTGVGARPSNARTERQPEKEQRADTPQPCKAAACGLLCRRPKPDRCQDEDRVAKEDVLTLVVREGQRGDPLAEDRVQACRNQVAEHVGAEDVGKAAAAGKEITLGAHVGEHGPQEWCQPCDDEQRQQ